MPLVVHRALQVSQVQIFITGTPGVTTKPQPWCKMSTMARQTYRRTFIREWREFRGLSLRKLADRVESEPGVTSITHASIQRIEMGEQPYTQPTLEALAAALNCEPKDLLNVNPTKEGKVVDILTELRHMNEEQQRRALVHIQAVKQAG